MEETLSYTTRLMWLLTQFTRDVCELADEYGIERGHAMRRAITSMLAESIGTDYRDIPTRNDATGDGVNNGRLQSDVACICMDAVIAAYKTAEEYGEDCHEVVEMVSDFMADWVRIAKE